MTNLYLPLPPPKPSLTSYNQSTIRTREATRIDYLLTLATEPLSLGDVQHPVAVLMDSQITPTILPNPLELIYNKEVGGTRVVYLLTLATQPLSFRYERHPVASRPHLPPLPLKAIYNTNEGGGKSQQVQSIYLLTLATQPLSLQYVRHPVAVLVDNQITPTLLPYPLELIYNKEVGGTRVVYLLTLATEPLYLRDVQHPVGALVHGQITPTIFPYPLELIYNKEVGGTRVVYLLTLATQPLSLRDVRHPVAVLVDGQITLVTEEDHVGVLTLVVEADGTDGVVLLVFLTLLAPSPDHARGTSLRLVYDVRLLLESVDDALERVLRQRGETLLASMLVEQL